MFLPFIPVTPRPCFYKENLEVFHRYVHAGIEISVVYIKVKVRVKQSHYRPGVAQRVPGS